MNNLADQDIEGLADEVLNLFPIIYYPFRHLLGRYSEYELTTLQILAQHNDWFSRAELRTRLNLNGKAVSKIMGPLIKTELVESRKDPESRRKSQEHITEKGNGYLKKTLTKRKIFIQEILKCLTPEGRVTIVNIIEKLKPLEDNYFYFLKIASAAASVNNWE